MTRGFQHLYQHSRGMRICTKQAQLQCCPCNIMKVKVKSACFENVTFIQLHRNIEINVSHSRQCSYVLFLKLALDYYGNGTRTIYVSFSRSYSPSQLVPLNFRSQFELLPTMFSQDGALFVCLFISNQFFPGNLTFHKL